VKRSWKVRCAPLAAVIAIVTASCSDDPAPPSPASAGGATGAGAAGSAGESGAGGEAGAAGTSGSGAFTLLSSAFVDQGTLPAAYTCDGAGTSPPLSWTGVPEGSAELALLLTTEALDGLKWNWVLYGIPPTLTSLPEGSMGTASAGLTSDGPLLQYAPPCSMGPGAKQYVFTLYALSDAAPITVAPEQVSGAYLTAAISDRTITSRTLTVSYTRP
jgi:phosphatidylethanolamine-binding protein (PEBP) family uncharacterized protein